MVLSFIESTFTTKAEYDAWIAGGSAPSAAPAKVSPSEAVPVKTSSAEAPCKTASTHPLCTVTEAADVEAEFKELAKSWPSWDSKTHPQKPKNSGKFRFDYNGEYGSERVLITSGAATLKPTDGSAAIKIKEGDRVIFWNGFSCDWTVTKRMTKLYAYYGEDGKPEGDEEEASEGINCDVCSADCFAESYFCEALGEDICPKCYEADTDKYKDAQHQMEGVAVKASKKRAAPKGGGKAKKKK